MLYHVTVGGRTFRVTLDADGVRVEGRPVHADLDRVEGTRVHSLLLDGASHRVVALRTGTAPGGGGSWELHLRGRRIEAEVVDERTRAIREMTGAVRGPEGPRPVRAPMPGLVVRVEVAEGDEVREGQGVVIVEAMKMENELAAEGAGRVRAVHVAAGDAVEKGQVLVDFETPDGEDRP